MGDLDTSFEKLFERQPSDEARQNLYRVKDTLGIKDNDALWGIIMALQYYQEMYKEIPGEIKTIVDNALDKINTTAKTAMQAAAETTKAELTAAVATIASQVARDTAAKERAKTTKEKVEWFTYAVLATAVCFLAVYWFSDQRAYKAGYKYGQAMGYRESKDEKAAAAWANTPEGKLGYRLAQKGSLQRLARCEGKGWVKKDKVCFPYAVPKGNLHGWRIPDS